MDSQGKPGRGKETEMKLNRRGQWALIKRSKPTDKLLVMKDGKIQGDPGPEWPESDSVMMILPDEKYAAPVPISNWLIHSDFVGPVIQKLRPAIAVEVGVFNGGSLLCMRTWARYHGVQCQFFGVDVWKFKPMSEGEDWDGEEVYQLLCRRTAKYANVHLLKMESAEGAEAVPDESVDLLHIDAWHTEDAVRRDLDLWLPKLAPHGVVLMHDVGIVTPIHQVYRVWREIQGKHPARVDTRGQGLGAFCPKGVHPSLATVFRQAIVL